MCLMSTKIFYKHISIFFILRVTIHKIKKIFNTCYIHFSIFTITLIIEEKNKSIFYFGWCNIKILYIYNIC